MHPRPGQRFTLVILLGVGCSWRPGGHRILCSVFSGHLLGFNWFLCCFISRV